MSSVNTGYVPDVVTPSELKRGQIGLVGQVFYGGLGAQQSVRLSGGAAGAISTVTASPGGQAGNTALGILQAASFTTVSAETTLPVSRRLLGTTNQVVLTDAGAGSTLTLSLPQDYHTLATPTLQRLTLTNTATASVVQQINLASGQTANAIVVTDSDGNDRFKVSAQGSITSQRQDANAEVFLRTCSDTNISPYWRSHRARGTLAAPTVVKASDVLGYFSFGGYNGEAWTATLAYLQATATADWAVGDTPTFLRLGTTPVGSTTVAERM